MTESQRSAPVNKYLRDNGCYVFKIADGFTSGIPDTQCTVNKVTTWIEYKIVKRGQTFLERAMQDKLQLQTMKDLSHHGYALYVMWKDGTMYILHPMNLEDASLVSGMKNLLFLVKEQYE